MTDQMTDRTPADQTVSGPELSGQTAADIEFNRMASRLVQREALRRAAADLNTASPAGLESALARISAETTAEAAERHTATLARTAAAEGKPT
jgi:hypothetical protein